MHEIVHIIGCHCGGLVVAFVSGPLIPLPLEVVLFLQKLGSLLPDVPASSDQAAN